MLTIHLIDIYFYAYHGLHQEERVIGNLFSVSMNITIEETVNMSALDQTLDYVKAYEIIKKHMMQATALLETLAQNISEEIALYSPMVRKTEISIYKNHPPISQFSGRVGISLIKEW